MIVSLAVKKMRMLVNKIEFMRSALHTVKGLHTDNEDDCAIRDELLVVMAGIEFSLQRQLSNLENSEVKGD